MGLGELLFLVNADTHNLGLYCILARGKSLTKEKATAGVASRAS